MMNWIQSLSSAIAYMEQHLTDDVSIDEVAQQAYTSAYWTAEGYPEGFFVGGGAFRFGYMFGVEL